MNSFKVSLAVLASSLVACGGGGDSEELALAVYKQLGSVQCTGGGVALASLVRELTDAGVPVASAACGLDGNAYPAVCGAPDGRIGILEVSPRQLQLAASLGFAPLSSLPAAVRASCT